MLRYLSLQISRALPVHWPSLCVFLLLFACTVISVGQTATGEVNGTITDRSGGAVGGATVRLTNAATNVTDQAQTNNKGYFVFINVQPGNYALSVEASGFKTAQVPAFQIAVNQTLTENAQWTWAPLIRRSR